MAGTLTVKRISKYLLEYFIRVKYQTKANLSIPKLEISTMVNIKSLRDRAMAIYLPKMIKNTRVHGLMIRKKE